MKRVRPVILGVLLLAVLAGGGRVWLDRGAGGPPAARETDAYTGRATTGPPVPSDADVALPGGAAAAVDHAAGGAGQDGGERDRYAGMPVLAERTGLIADDGTFERERLVRTPSKHALHRVVDRWQQTDVGPDLMLQQTGMAADHVLAVFDPDVPDERIREQAAAAGIRVQPSPGIPQGYVLSVDDPDLDSVNQLLTHLAAFPGVRLADPNFAYWTMMTSPDDPRYAEQWNLDMIQMPSVWGATVGTGGVVVAVFDTGTTLWHPDLHPTLWTHPGETEGNGLDDDGNGYVDDFYGWNFYANNNDPSDEHGHGTHVSGIIGAAGNNATGISGVGWYIRILPIRFMGPNGIGYAEDAASGMYYVRNLVSAGYPVRVTNHSWGGSGYSRILEEAFAFASAKNVLHVAAAGNTHTGGTNNDVFPFYPTGFTVSNLLAVANSTQLDALRFDSHYGSESVDLAAPGTSILSTLMNGGYGHKTGTSMSAPLVAGVAALLIERFPERTAAQIAAAITAGVDPVSTLDGKVATGGRLNAYGAFRAAGIEIDHDPLPDVEAESPYYRVEAQVRPGASFLQRAALLWNTTGSSSAFTTNEMSLLPNDRFQADIPGRPAGNRVYYWIRIETLDGQVTTHPAGAPEALHSFAFDFSVKLHVQGVPGPYGSVLPAYGVHEYPWGSIVTLEAPLFSEPQFGSRWRNRGWDGVGSVPYTGTTNRLQVVLYEDSYLAWKWQQQFPLSQVSDPLGILEAQDWRDRGSLAQTRKAPELVEWNGEPFRFVGWWVDGTRRPNETDPAVNPVDRLLMHTARAAEARYVRAEQVSYADGLPDWWKLRYFNRLDDGAYDYPVLLWGSLNPAVALPIDDQLILPIPVVNEGTGSWSWHLEDPAAGDAPAWLRPVAASGTLPAGASGELAWIVDSTGLEPGLYEAEWSVRGNDPQQVLWQGTVALTARAPAHAFISRPESPAATDLFEFVLRWQTETGLVYSLFTGTNLNQASWSPVPGYTNMPGGGMMSYTGHVERVPARFFRILEQ